MPKVNEMYPSRYLKAADCEDAELVLTIKSIEEEKIGTDDKWVVYFRGEDKGLVLNKTNTNVIAKLYGDDTDDWIGKAITLYATEVQFQGDMVEAIRVRSKVPKTAKAKVTTPPAREPGDDDEDEMDGSPF